MADNRNMLFNSTANAARSLSLIFGRKNDISDNNHGDIERNIILGLLKHSNKHWVLRESFSIPGLLTIDFKTNENKIKSKRIGFILNTIENTYTWEFIDSKYQNLLQQQAIALGDSIYILMTEPAKVKALFSFLANHKFFLNDILRPDKTFASNRYAEMNEIFAYGDVDDKSTLLKP